MVATPGSSAPFVASDETDYSTSEDDDEEGVTQRGVAQKGVVQRGVAVPTKNDTSDSEVSEQNLLELVKWSPFKSTCIIIALKCYNNTCTGFRTPLSPTDFQCSLSSEGHVSSIHHHHHAVT